MKSGPRPATLGYQEVDVMRAISAFLANESGATAIEYALIASGLSIVILASVNGIGTSLNAVFKSVSTTLK